MSNTPSQIRALLATPDTCSALAQLAPRAASLSHDARVAVLEGALASAQQGAVSMAHSLGLVALDQIGIDTIDAVANLHPAQATGLAALVARRLEQPSTAVPTRDRIACALLAGLPMDTDLQGSALLARCIQAIDDLAHTGRFGIAA